jgi:hypothetical protein
MLLHIIQHWQVSPDRDHLTHPDPHPLRRNQLCIYIILDNLDHVTIQELVGNPPLVGFEVLVGMPILNFSHLLIYVVAQRSSRMSLGTHWVI